MLSISDPLNQSIIQNFIVIKKVYPRNFYFYKGLLFGLEKLSIYWDFLRMVLYKDSLIEF